MGMARWERLGDPAEQVWIYRASRRAALQAGEPAGVHAQVIASDESSAWVTLSVEHDGDRYDLEIPDGLLEAVTMAVAMARKALETKPSAEDGQEEGQA